MWAMCGSVCVTRWQFHFFVSSFASSFVHNSTCLNRLEARRIPSSAIEFVSAVCLTWFVKRMIHVCDIDTKCLIQTRQKNIVHFYREKTAHMFKMFDVRLNADKKIYTQNTIEIKCGSVWVFFKSKYLTEKFMVDATLYFSMEQWLKHNQSYPSSWSLWSSRILDIEFILSRQTTIRQICQLAIKLM